MSYSELPNKSPMTDYDFAVSRLWKILPPEQIDAVMGQEYVDIDCFFLGFIETYEALSKLIPKHFTVIDLGCAYNPQCYYFTEHKAFIGVDSFDKTVRFCSPNCTIYKKKIGDFIKQDLGKFNLKETFAICNYVPMWGEENKKIVGETFENLFIYYPHGGHLHTINLK